MKQEFIEDNIQILSKQTMDLFLKQKKPSELIALYMFYYYTAKWQKTNQAKAATKYVATGLRWGEKKTRDTKKELIDLGLIEELKKINRKTKKIEGWYVKLNFIWKQASEAKLKEKSHPRTFPQGGFNHRVVSVAPNALSANSLNALSANNKIPFSFFWDLYAKKKARPKVEAKWNRLTREEQQTVMEHIPIYKQTDTVKKGFQQYPLTYLNNRTWEDETDTKRKDYKTMSDFDLMSEKLRIQRARENGEVIDSTELVNELYRRFSF
jgi:hypothetical protein